MPNPFSRFATPPFLTPEQGRMMAQQLPPWEEELPEALPLAPPPRGGASRPSPPPVDVQGPPGGLPDPTMMTQRPERPLPDSMRKWQEAEELVNSIQGQRPRLEDNKPSFWNKLAGGIAGGLGGYMASSPSAVTRGNAQMAFDLAPKLLRPGYDQKMQNWGADLQAAQDRAKRAKAGLTTDMDIEESRSNQDYKQAAADYQRQLPGIAAAKAEAGMVEITPEAAKDLEMPDDMIGLKVPSSAWTEMVKKHSFAMKNKAELEKTNAIIEGQNQRNQDTLDSREQEGDRNRKSQERRTQMTVDGRKSAASITANKAKGWKDGSHRKEGDKYFATLYNPDTKEYIDAVDASGNRIEVAPPREEGADMSMPDLPKAGGQEPPKAEPAKPATAVKANPTKPAQVVTEAQIKNFMDKTNARRTAAGKPPMTRAEAISKAKGEGFDTSKLKP